MRKSRWEMSRQGRLQFGRLKLLVREEHRWSNESMFRLDRRIDRRRCSDHSAPGHHHHAAKCCEDNIGILDVDGKVDGCRCIVNKQALLP